jgi:hypothetical protein
MGTAAKMTASRKGKIYFYGGIMKKVISVFVLSLVLTGTAVFAQDAGGLDLSSTVPQFFSFDLGAGIGYALDNTLDNQTKGATVIGLKVAVIDNLEVGIDILSCFSGTSPAFAGLRIGYRFTPVLGAAIGIGAAAVTEAAATNPESGISLGVFYDLFADRSKNGIVTGLKVRVDYITGTSDIAKGALLFTPVFTIGL